MKKFLLGIFIIGAVQWWYTDPTIETYSDNVSFTYIVKYPDDNRKSDYLPMLVVLHGNGDTPDHFYETAMDQFNMPVRIILLEGPVSFAGGKAWPWKPAELNKFGRAVNEAVELLTQKYETVQKPILLGYSGGGMMAYYQALKYGNRYSYIFPVSGKLNKDLIGDDLFEPGSAVFAYHGKSDNLVSIGAGKNAVKLLLENGVDIKFNEFSGGHLGLFTNMKTEITQAIEEKIEKLERLEL